VRIARSQIRHRVLVRTLIAVPLSLALALMATNVATAAGQPFDASGTSVGTGVELSNFRYAPPCGCVVTFLDLTATGTMSGTFQGQYLIEDSCVVPPTGQAACHGTVTFTGTVNGVSGTARFNQASFIDGSTGASHGTFTAVSGTGGLANLRGHGTFDDDGYAGTFVFAG
jgi:Protein of unknown function (DUF3224)